MLDIDRSAYLAMIGHAYDGLPLEACGLLAGEPGGGPVRRFFPCRNEAASSRVYTVDGRDYLRADREAEDEGLELVGVMHSHTHTSAYPSPTDLQQVSDPAWHYVIVSLRDPEPMVRSYGLASKKIAEEPVRIRIG